MARGWLYLERLDVAHDHEALFDEVAAAEYLPRLARVPGVRRAARFHNPAPTDPRHMLAFELEAPEVAGSPAWTAAVSGGRWAHEVWPRTLNRRHALYAWAGGGDALTHRTPFVFWVMMDVEPRREALFNELYDREHIPLLLELPGSIAAVRYVTAAPGHPRYLAVYEVEHAELPMSPRWNETSDVGRWKPEVRPYTHNKRFIVSRRV